VKLMDFDSLGTKTSKNFVRCARKNLILSVFRIRTQILARFQYCGNRRCSVSIKQVSGVSNHFCRPKKIKVSEKMIPGSPLFAILRVSQKKFEINFFQNKE